MKTTRGMFLAAFAAAAIAATAAAESGAPRLRLSIFSTHVEDIARQERISFAAAAAKVRAAGIDGIAVVYGIQDDKLAEVRRQGFAVACVVGFPKFEMGYDENLCGDYVSLAVSNGCRQVMLVPGFYPTENEDPALFADMTRRTRRFAEMAAARGVETLVEDFNNPKSPTCGFARTKAFLDAVPSIGFVYDTGNFNSPGERPESGLALLPRVRHFHLKDRPAGNARGACAVGSGTVPIAKIVFAALDAGYDGWFTIEHFGATNMLECATASAKYLRSLQFCGKAKGT